MADVRTEQEKENADFVLDLIKVLKERDAAIDKIINDLGENRLPVGDVIPSICNTDAATVRKVLDLIDSHLNIGT